MKPTLYIIDGFSIVFRMYHAVRGLKRDDGFPTNALYGLCTKLFHLQDRYAPDHVVVALDSPGKTFRSDLDPTYKANRLPPEEDLGKQLGATQRFFEAFGVPVLRQDGVEADDIIATLVRQHQEMYAISIVSSDKDLAQLVDDVYGVRMVDIFKDVVLDGAGVHAKWGVYPSQMLDYLSLVGDTADNIPGVPGVGPKTAASLLVEHKDVEGILLSKSDCKRVAKVVAHGAQLQLSQQLVALKSDVSLCAYTPSPLQWTSELVAVLREFQLNKPADRVQKEVDRLAAEQPSLSIFE